MLFYIYSDAPASTIDITSRCRVGRFQVKDNAEEGSVAISSLIVDDPDGDLEITGHRRMYIYESDAPIFDQVVFNGFVVNERVERGPYRTGPGRQWVIDLADPNVLINRRIMNGADANRPAEPDLERIQALLTMTELNTVDDDTYVNTTAATTAMDAVDYRGQNVGAYIDDCRQASGKNGYILYNETLGQYGLWYDFDYSTEYDSSCFLTNTIGENNDSTVFLYSQERTYLNRDPSRVASGIYLEYDGGTVYVQNAATTAAFAAIDWAAPSVNVKSLAKATDRADRYLADAETEDDVIHVVMTKVPRSKVNKIRKGQLVQFKSTYMTDYTTYTTFRVLYRTVTEISEDPQNSFEIEMDLSPIPGVPCDDQDADATFPANNSNTAAGTGNVVYFRAGCADPGFAPNPGYMCDPHFALYNQNRVGDLPDLAGYDLWGDNVGNALIIMCVGDGTIAIQTIYSLGGLSTLTAWLQHNNTGFDITDETQTGITPGSIITFDVSSHDGTFCNHRVLIKDTTGPGGNGWGFYNAVWTAA